MKKFDKLSKRLKEEYGIIITDIKREYPGHWMRKQGAFVWTAKIFNRVEIGSIYSVTELLKAKNWDIVHEIGDIAIYPKD